MPCGVAYDMGGGLVAFQMGRIVVRRRLCQLYTISGRLLVVNGLDYARKFLQMLDLSTVVHVSNCFTMWRTKAPSHGRKLLL